MLIMRTSAYAAAGIIGAAALTATLLTTTARASSWEYGYGYGGGSPKAQAVAIMDLESTYYGCTNLTLVSDTREGAGSWYAVEAGLCGVPK